MKATAYRVLSAAVLGAAAFVSPLLVSAAAAQDASNWANPVKPFKIGEGLYYVGAYDLTAYLFVSKAGLIVLDGGDQAVGKQVVANIRTLGFDPAQVKITLRFRGRELAHPELGMKLLQKVKADFEPVAKVEYEPRMEGRQMIMILAPR